MTRRARVLLGVVVVLALGWMAWHYWGAQLLNPAPTQAPADTTQAGMQGITLWFADDSGDSLVSEVREVSEQTGLHERLQQMLDALVRGPEHRGVALLPPGTSVLHAYLDDRGLLTLDLSRAFTQGFHGGSRAEDLVVGSLVRTIGTDFPEVRQVLIVCGGAPIASLGGHMPLDRPIDPHAVP